MGLLFVLFEGESGLAVPDVLCLAVLVPQLEALEFPVAGQSVLLHPVDVVCITQVPQVLLHLVLFELDVLLLGVHQLVLILEVLGGLPLENVLLLDGDLPVYPLLVVGQVQQVYPIPALLLPPGHLHHFLQRVYVADPENVFFRYDLAVEPLESSEVEVPVGGTWLGALLVEYPLFLLVLAERGVFGHPELGIGLQVIEGSDGRHGVHLGVLFTQNHEHSHQAKSVGVFCHTWVASDV